MHVTWPLGRERKHSRTLRRQRHRENETGWKQTSTVQDKDPGVYHVQGLRHHSASGSATESEPPEDSRPASCPLKCPSRSSAPASVFGRGVRIDSFLPTYISRIAELLFLFRTTRDKREGRGNGELGRGREKAIKVWGTSQHCHTQDGGAAVARSFRGGTNACAAQSPGPGHKMAAAALGRARRRRQNGRSSRTCDRIPSSPLRAAADSRSPLGPCQLSC